MRRGLSVAGAGVALAASLACRVDESGTDDEADPSLGFETVRAFPRRSALDFDGPNQAYHARLLQSAEELRDVVDLRNAVDGDRLAGVDFDEAAVVLVESGFGSGSVSHCWQRVGREGAALHLHGCYTRPVCRTADDVARHSAVVVECPEPVSVARVSLTVAGDGRVHFNSTEGVVTTPE